MKEEFRKPHQFDSTGTTDTFLWRKAPYKTICSDKNKGRSRSEKNTVSEIDNPFSLEGAQMVY